MLPECGQQTVIADRGIGDAAAAASDPRFKLTTKTQSHNGPFRDGLLRTGPYHARLAI